uniref:G-protein coupled receptors family 1 profile domain-containing protein n=1 Tax=Ditylenchus dipsaci TaxID=166011 RepID=A0A915D9W8_9BILA
MYVYMISHVVLACTSMLYLIYVIGKWDPDTITQYDKHIMYWLGLVDSNYIYITPIPVLFLTLDRMFSYMCPDKYGHVQRRHLLLLTLWCILFIYVGFSTVTLLELPLQAHKVAQCVNFACMMIRFGQKPQLYCKLGKNRAVKVTLVVEICFNILPTFFNFFSSIISSEPLNNYLGQYVEMFCMLDAACCSILYTLIFIKRKKDNVRNEGKTFFTMSTHMTN